MLSIVDIARGSDREGLNANEDNFDSRQPLRDRLEAIFLHKLPCRRIVGALTINKRECGQDDGVVV